MYARSTTLHGKPEAIEASIAQVRDEVMPAVQQMDGQVGVSMLVDRESGGCIVTTSWESLEAMRASAQAANSLREKAAVTAGDPRPEVREWEIAVLHRIRPTGEGAWARVTWTQNDPSAVDQQLETFRMGVLPRMEELPGFCGASLLIDRESGRSALAAAYESRDALAESREGAMDLRLETVRQLSMQIIDVAEFEVALAHLRVPETV